MSTTSFPIRRRCWQRPATRPRRSHWRAAAAELEEIERSEQERLRLLDLWQFQRKEIESANLQAEEDAALENERRVLQNVQRLEEAAAAAYDAVYESEESAQRLTRAAFLRQRAPPSPRPFLSRSLFL